jgi:hypothetical protein
VPISWITQLVSTFPDYSGTRRHFIVLWTLYLLNPSHFQTPRFKYSAFLSRLNLFIFLHNACCISYSSSLSCCCAFILFNEEHELWSFKLCDFSRPLVKMPIDLLSNIYEWKGRQCSLWRNFSLHTARVISWPTEGLSNSKDKLCFMEFIV